MKLMVIDGNSIINRAFYGIRPLTTRDGTPTNAVYGFVVTLQRLIDEETPDAVCVTFDRREPTFRHLSYEEELEAKRVRVQDALQRIGGADIEVAEILGSEEDNTCLNRLLDLAKKNGAADNVTAVLLRRY